MCFIEVFLICRKLSLLRSYLEKSVSAQRYLFLVYISMLFLYNVPFISLPKYTYQHNGLFNTLYETLKNVGSVLHVGKH